MLFIGVVFSFCLGPAGVCAGGFFFVFLWVFVFCGGVVVGECGGWCVGIVGGVCGGLCVGVLEGGVNGCVVWGLVVGWYEYNS